jgi:deoxyribodipyrimidine photolyase-related protein
MKCRNLVLILGDQLDLHGAALQGFDPAQDIVFMAEVPEDCTLVVSHKARIILTLTAMRHFADDLKRRGFPCDYEVTGEHAFPTLKDALTDAAHRRAPERILVTEPGEHRIEQMLRESAKKVGVPLEVREDTHFLLSKHEFALWAEGQDQKQDELRMEGFYRYMRRRSGILMDGMTPRGGKWVHEPENHGRANKEGFEHPPAPPVFPPDTITRKVVAEVERRYASHPGDPTSFAWPVTRVDAITALRDFVRHRLPLYGRYQDAMWTGEPWLYHSQVSAALNLKLLNPREVLAAAVQAHHQGHVPVDAVESFVRGVLGWREFLRGMYWLDMPDMRDANHFGHTRKLPAWYRTGNTQMNCMRQTIGQTLKHGYAHQPQRLMVTGQFALLAEVAPREVADWYLGAYADAVEWATLPNVMGIALYANGGRFTNKPYIVSGIHIDRTSNYCAGCRYRADEKTGSRACPMTTLYWHFLDKHEAALAANPRTAPLAANLAKLKGVTRTAIREQAAITLTRLDSL